MKSKPSFWQRIGLHDWFLKKDTEDTLATTPTLTPDAIFKYIVDKFQESIHELSFADRIVFYHEYIIAFNTEDYKEFMENKKGIFGLIVQESVKKFYELLKGYRAQGKTVEPSASKWVFRFVSHPDYYRGDKGFIGKLLPGATQKEENLRVTFIPRQTGIAQTSDISFDILKGFTFYSEGYYEVPYIEELRYDERKVNVATPTGTSFARFEAIVPDKAFAGKKIEYFMRDEEIVVSGKDDTREASTIFRVPSEWVNTPHLRIRYNRADDKFYLASFGEKTMLNEKAISRSDTANPTWTELPINSKLVLNGIVGINIFKS
ncbi:hypothetical protein [Flavisolibacter tropicus]|uniref:Uncharacterized protein n=1 Tax=Flavisolibacter tropicus TaxID=1492898 RepID=A0A172U0H1_9BACT|nr:hypothetical protein [Flavisolibacter tropicus]ANE52722.1 hypothetical protein SY85_21825 [Flavisolibacter tropicus]